MCNLTLCNFSFALHLCNSLTQFAYAIHLSNSSTQFTDFIHGRINHLRISHLRINHLRCNQLRINHLRSTHWGTAVWGPCWGHFFHFSCPSPSPAPTTLPPGSASILPTLPLPAPSRLRKGNREAACSPWDLKPGARPFRRPSTRGESSAKASTQLVAPRVWTGVKKIRVCRPERKELRPSFNIRQRRAEGLGAAGQGFRVRV